VEERGRVNISLSDPAGAAMAYVAQRFPFKENLGLTQLGLAYAIRKGIAPVRDDSFARPAGVQNMNLGSFDSSGEIRALLKVLFPDSGDPAVVAETLMNLGLLALEADIRSGVVSRLSDLMYENAEV
jgi:hypothetical protein